MTRKQMENFAWWSRAMASLGFTDDEIHALRRIEMTLRRWHELECGSGNDYASWHVERDEKTGKPFLVRWSNRDPKPHRYAIPDRETGARKRLAAIMAKHPELWSYVQTDPRGGALYVGKHESLMGQSVDCAYSRGVYCNF